MNSSARRLLPTPWGRIVIYTLAAATVWLLLVSQGFSASRDNGFDLSNTLVPQDQIFHGGPPRDGIPSIDAPKFITPDAADFLSGDDRVLGMQRNGVTKAYPIKILNYHEIVNDKFGDDAVVITYCPLCGTGMGFSASVAGQTRTFGVSGLLYNSDVLLYDRESESLWSQIMSTAISGKMRGTDLDQLPLDHTTWQDWRARYPDTMVLSTDTGYARNYSRTPYEGYEISPKVWFPVANVNRKYHPKELVIGLTIGNSSKVYPFTELARTSSGVRDRFAGQELEIEFDARHRTGRVLNGAGEEIPSTIAYWFAWIAFHPDTDIFEAADR